jgi:hypothetical protein
MAVASLFRRSMILHSLAIGELLRSRNPKGEMKRQSRSVVTDLYDFIGRIPSSRTKEGKWLITLKLDDNKIIGSPDNSTLDA